MKKKQTKKEKECKNCLCIDNGKNFEYGSNCHCPCHKSNNIDEKGTKLEKELEEIEKHKPLGVRRNW